MAWTDFVDSTPAVASEVNANFVDVVPIGGIIAWAKTITGVPSLSDRYVECNGQVLSDGDSLLDGQTIPDLNASSGTARFLRGGTTSGSTGGSETHTHGTPRTQSSTNPGSGSIYGINSATSDSSSTLPSYYTVVWVMRVK